MSNKVIKSFPLSLIQTNNPIDEVISSGIQIYFPISKGTKIGILFEPNELIKIYIQVDAITEDILIQFKIIELHVPFSLTELFFFLGLAHYYSQKFMTLIEVKNITFKNNYP